VALRPVLSNGLPFREQAQDRAQGNESQETCPETLTLITPMADEPRHLSELLSQGSLARLLGEAERRRMETVRVRSLLPAEEGAHLVSASTNSAGELVLVMDTPSWAARVRYSVGALPGAAVKIKVRPSGG
jgi:hypothetical protein